MWAQHGEDALGDVRGEWSLCMHLPAAGRRRWGTVNQGSGCSAGGYTGAAAPRADPGPGALPEIPL